MISVKSSLVWEDQVSSLLVTEVRMFPWIPRSERTLRKLFRQMEVVVCDRQRMFLNGLSYKRGLSDDFVGDVFCSFDFHL